MSGIINFLRNPSAVVGKLFYLGGESGKSDEDFSNIPSNSHFLTCSDPDVSPNSCSECDVTWSYSDGSFVLHDGDNVYSIGEVEVELLKYYNELAPEGWDQAAYRPFRWITATDQNSPNKYKTVKMLVDKDGDIWYVLVGLKTPITAGSTYIHKLRKQFEDV